MNLRPTRLTAASRPHTFHTLMIRPETDECQNRRAFNQRPQIRDGLHYPT